MNVFDKERVSSYFSSYLVRNKILIEEQYIARHPVGRNLARVQLAASAAELHVEAAAVQQPEAAIPVAVRGGAPTAQLPLHVRPQQTRHGRGVSPEFLLQGATLA